jgi:hypothetical protein
MPSRVELEQRARVLGITASNYPNDSQLDQRIKYAEKNAATQAGTLNTTTLTQNGSAPTNGDTLTLGANIYTYVTALTETAASQTITDGNGTNFSDGDFITIGTTSYRFKTTIVQPNDVAIGATADLTLTNLVDAITGTGTAGTNYANGTVTNTQVTAGAVTAHATTISAINVGVAGNGITLTTTAASVTLGGATLAGGVEPVANQILISTAANSLVYLKAAINGASGVGTTYSHGTIAHPLATAGTISGSTLPVSSTASGNDGPALATTGSTGGATLSWTGTTMSGYVGAVIASSTYSAPGQPGAALVGV